MDCSLPGSSVYGILQARILEWVAISFSRGEVTAAAKSLVVSDSVRPHRRQPTRLPRPWDSPGKNTGVGCQFLLQCMKVKSESEVAQSCPTLSDPMDCSLLGSSVHGIFQARVLEWGAISFSREAHAAAKSHQSCLTLCDLIDCSPGEGNGTPLQYSSLENPMDGGA